MQRIPVKPGLSAITYRANNQLRINKPVYAIEFNNAGGKAFTVNDRTIPAGDPWSIGGNENVEIAVDSVFNIQFDSTDTNPLCQVTIYYY